MPDAIKAASGALRAMMRPALPAVAALFLLLSLSCTDGLPPEFPVPEFSLSSPLTGMVVDNAAIANRPAIMYWFTSW